MTKPKPRTPKEGRPTLYFIIWSIALTALFAWFLRGKDIRVLNPKGYIAEHEFGLIVFATIAMLAICIPTLFLFYFFAWKYRETNTKATFEPQRRSGKKFVFAAWAIPCFVMLVMGVVVWEATHRLDPKAAIASDKKPVLVQVIALRWKWLFIYPEQGIATVNYVQTPVDTPIEFDLTADDAPMSSFWVPSWGGQLYAMTGHSNQLHLMPTVAGDYQGVTAELNGKGFADMKFTARASTQADFDKWVASTKRSTKVLDKTEYQKLLQPTEKNPAAFYSSIEPDMYNTALMKYAGSHDMSAHESKTEDTQHNNHMEHMY
jgi:cytochrome o ubiquinol oxidase subunit 2